MWETLDPSESHYKFSTLPHAVLKFQKKWQLQHGLLAIIMISNRMDELFCEETFLQDINWSKSLNFLSKMSFGDLRRDASEYTPDSSDSDVESQNSSCVRGKPKRVDKTFACWKFRDTIQADFSGLGSLGERRQKLIEHFRTRTSLERPLCVRSVTVFADLDQLVLDAPDETRTISISIIGYVQTKPSRKFAMTNWIKSANWEPVIGGLFSNS